MSLDERALQPGPTSRLSRLAMAVLWPSFLMSGVLEVLVFAVIDPGDMNWFGGAPIDLPRQAIYTLSFLIFWLLISLAASLSLLLVTMPDPPARPHPRQWPR
ncbi:hypothetical protein [Roseateles violae]|uniref:Transmembrane protein n=1 Tax=Roseateles violae TaxID=3058042 RepID=A0ABT8DY76_9BURK|nr:hypothetical protein [Pelomonas sp. PFR6]MDN3922036.1 hypothetical protein [Pelomonas sp. PFR6]